MDYLEQAILDALKLKLDAGQIRIADGHKDLVAEVSRKYPWSFSKIDWALIPESVERAQYDRSLQVQSFTEFFDEMRLRHELRGTVLYVGDNLTEFILEGAVEVLRDILPDLLRVPQHHYFFGENYGWCMCMSFEGDMGFGRVGAIAARYP